MRGAAGASLGVWWLDGPPIEPHGVVLLCEGESDALAALSVLSHDEPDVDGAARFARRAIAAVASVPGAGFPRDRLVTALRAVDPGEILLAFDGDPAGEKAVAEVGQALLAAGLRPRRVAIPAGEDLASAMAAEDRPARWLGEAIGDSVPLTADALAETPDNGRYDGRRYDLAELVASAGDEPPWRVEGIAADGHLTALSAQGGEGKTWACLAFTGGVAHGSTIAGLRCVQGRAVIFDAENGRYVLGSRLGALDPGLPSDRVAIYDAEGLRLDDARDRAWILEVIRRERANLAVLDSLRALAPDAAENDSDDMAPIVSGAKAIARQSGAAVVLLIHRGHGTADFRGSTAIRDAVDLLFVLERVADDPERSWRRRLRCSKCRIAAEPDERWLGVQSWHGQVSLAEAEPFERGAAARSPEDVAEDLSEVVLAAVAEHRPASANAVAKLGLGRRKDVLATVKALEGAGRVRRTPQGLEVVPEGAEPPGNHLSEALGGGGSEARDRPVGPPPLEPPRTLAANGGTDVAAEAAEAAR